MRISRLAIMVLLATACAPKADRVAAPASLSAADLDAVKGVETAFATAMNAGDTAAIFALYADDAQILPQDSPMLNKAAAHPEMAGFIAAHVSDVVEMPTTVYGIGDLAYVVGRVTYTLGGKPGSMKYVEVLRKATDGKWRYVVDAYSNDTPVTVVPAKTN